MKKIRTLVVDDSKKFCNEMKEYFENNKTVEIVKILEDGNKVIPYLEKNKESIDVIIMDLIMPGKDGIQILQEMENLKIDKHIIVLSSYRKEYTIRMTSRFNVDYYMLKPCNIEALESRIKEICLEEKTELYADINASREIQVKISNILHDLGVPSQIKGFQYLREGILMLYQTTGLIGGITKEIYPEIARRYATTPSRVERAIRHAIEVSWNRADYQVMNQIFGHSIDYDRAKPTNSEFMVTLSDALRIGNHSIRAFV